MTFSGGTPMKTFFALKKNSQSITEGMKHSLHINNMGYYLGIHEDITISRPSGREDYHLIYVSSGSIKVCDMYLRSGDFYVFFPGQKQEYTYKKQAESLYYWVHFTGNEVPYILENAKITMGYHKSNGRKNEAFTLFRLLTDAIVHAETPSIPYTTSLLLSLLQLLGTEPMKTYPFSKAINILEDTNTNTPISETAKIYKMSTSHFIRCFKETYGITPANYRISYRIMQAKNLLTSTSLSISSISEMCGFSDALYFSRTFKKHTKMSPSLYRYKHLDI